MSLPSTSFSHLKAQLWEFSLNVLGLVGKLSHLSLLLESVLLLVEDRDWGATTPIGRLVATGLEFSLVEALRGRGGRLPSSRTLEDFIALKQ